MNLESFISSSTFISNDQYPTPKFTFNEEGVMLSRTFPTYYSPLSPFAAVVQSLVGFEVGRRMEAQFTKVSTDPEQMSNNRRDMTTTVLEDFSFDEDGIRTQWRNWGILSPSCHIQISMLINLDSC
jgi:hypothetical protein